MAMERLADKPIIDSVDETTKFIIATETFNLDGEVKQGLKTMHVSTLRNIMKNDTVSEITRDIGKINPSALTEIELLDVEQSDDILAYQWRAKSVLDLDKTYTVETQHEFESDQWTFYTIDNNAYYPNKDPMGLPKGTYITFVLGLDDNGYGVMDILNVVTPDEMLVKCSDIQGLKLLKTITLEEAAASIETTFEKPVKELYVRFIGALDIEVDVTNCSIIAFCNTGLQYFRYSLNQKFSPNVRKVIVFHSKEVTPRYWETDYPDAMLNITDIGEMQGIGEHTANVKRSCSTRLNTRVNLDRYVKDLAFKVQNAKYSFAVGSTLEIYGVEVDE